MELDETDEADEDDGPEQGSDPLSAPIHRTQFRPISTAFEKTKLRKSLKTYWSGFRDGAGFWDRGDAARPGRN